MSSFSMFIDRWQPATINRLMGMHWAQRARIKRADAEVIAAYARQCHIPRATGPRRLDMLLVLKPRQRATDPDANFKSAVDGCVKAGLLVNDSPRWLALMPVQYSRGMDQRWGVAFTFTDLDRKP